MESAKRAPHSDADYRRQRQFLQRDAWQIDLSYARHRRAGNFADASRVLKIAFRNAGDIVLLLDGFDSETTQQHPPSKNFRPREYSKSVAGIVVRRTSRNRLAAEKRLIDCLVALATRTVIASAHDISRWRLWPRLLPNPVLPSRALGATVRSHGHWPDEAALFGERGAALHRQRLSEMLAALATDCATIRRRSRAKSARSPDGSLRIEYKGRAVIDSQSRRCAMSGPIRWNARLLNKMNRQSSHTADDHFHDHCGVWASLAMKKPPSWPIWACTRCSIAARNPPALFRATGANCTRIAHGRGRRNFSA